MITKVDSTIENLKNLWIELFLDKTNKVSNVADGSVLNATAYGTAKVGQKAIKDIAIIEAKLFPDTATGEYLDKCAALYGVSPRKAALGSSTYIRVYAQPGTVYDESVVFVNKNGIRFSVDQPITVDSTGYGYVGVRSINAGLATNVAPNSITTVTPQPVGHFECTNEYYAIGGRDNEDDETFRIRIKNNNNKLSKGTIEYWTQILQEVDPRVLKVMNVGLGENGIYELYIVSQNGILFTQNELDTMLEQTKDFFGLFELNLEGEVMGIVFKNAEWFYVGSERGIDFRVDINPEYNVTDVRKNIQVGLTKYLDFRFWTAGGIVQWDDLLDVVKKAEGVKFVPDEFFFPFYDEQVPLNQLPRIRGFIMRDLKGNILYDANSNLSPLFYPAESDIVFRGITDSSLALSQTVYFNVFDEQGNPIENARISVGNNSILTDPNGQGVITLINGNYTYSVNKQRYEIYQGTFIILNNSVIINVTLILAPYSINFVIIDEFNQPLPNAEIAIDNRTIVTNSNGLATIAVKNGTYPYTITKLGYEQISGDSVVVDNEDVSVSETMYLYAWDISILVQDEMAAPLPGVIVSIGSNTYLSNDEGKVSFKLVNGNYNVSLKKVGYIERNVNFTIQNQDQSFTYQMELFAYTFTMNVVDPENKPVVGAQVGLNDNQYSGITDENGTIIFKLVNGSYNYKVLKREFDDLSGSFNIQNADLELNLKTVYRYFQVIITAVDEFQKAIAGATVLINNETFQTNNQGQITASLQNGTYPYTITKLGYYDFNGNITVLGADVSDVANMTGRLYNLLFTVKQGDNFISGATVLVFGRSLTTDEKGQATTQLINGSYPYTISKLGYLEYEGTAVISNQDTNVNVSLELKPWNIILTVYDRGTTVAGATVAINGETLTTNESGIINTTLVNGTYDYTASKTGYVETQGQLIVNDADQSYDIIIEPIAYDVTFKVVEDTGAEPKDGFYIQDTSNKLYTKDEWNALATKPTPNGVAVVQGEHRFVVAPNNAVSPTKAWSTSDVLIEGIVSTQSNTVARADFAGKENTEKIIAQIGTNGIAASTAIEYIFANGIEGYLPSLGELYVTAQNRDTIEELLLLINGTKFATDRHYWASTQVQAGWYWAINYSNNTDTFEARTTSNYIRAYSPLVLEAGIPIEGVTVKVGEQPYTTDAAGEVHMNIYSGLYQVAYSKEGYQSYAGQVEVSGIEVFEQALKKIYALDFLASSASREALADVTIIVEGNAVIDGPITVTTDAMGKTNPIAVVNGDYSYSATKTDYSSLEGTGSISNANKTENIELVAGYPTTFSVTGPVDGIDGPIEGASILVDNIDTIVTDATGIAVTPLMNGQHRWAITKDGYLSQSGNVTIASAEQTVNIELVRGASITFLITDDSTPVANATISVSTGTSRGLISQGTTNTEGKWTAQLEEGNYFYTVEKIGYKTSDPVNFTVTNVAQELSLDMVDNHYWRLSFNGGLVNTSIALYRGDSASGTLIETKTVTDSNPVIFIQLVNDTYYYVATLDGYKTLENTVIISKSNQEITLEPIKLSTVTFVVIIEGITEPVSGATVSYRNMEKITNDQGRAVFTDIINGTSEYTVTPLPPYNGKTGSVTVNDADVTVQVQLNALVNVNFKVQENLADGVYIYGSKGEVIKPEDWPSHRKYAIGAYLQTIDNSVYTKEQYMALSEKPKVREAYIQTINGNLYTLEEYRALFPEDGVYIQTKDNKLYTKTEYENLVANKPAPGVYIQTVDGSLYTKEQYTTLTGNKKGPGVYVQDINGNLYSEDDLWEGKKPTPGIYIQDINNLLYTRAEWTALATKPTPNGIAVVSDNCKFVIYPSENSSSMSWGGSGTTISGIVTTTASATAITDYLGNRNTDKIITQLGSGNAPIADYCRSVVFANGQKGYLPSLGEWKAVFDNRTEVDTCLSLIGGTVIDTSTFQWSSTQYSSTNAWVFSCLDGKMNSATKGGERSTRAFTPLKPKPIESNGIVVIVDKDHSFVVGNNPFFRNEARCFNPLGYAISDVPCFSTRKIGDYADQIFTGRDVTEKFLQALPPSPNNLTPSVVSDCANFTFPGGQLGNLASLGHYRAIVSNIKEFNNLSDIIENPLFDTSTSYWSMQQQSSTRSFLVLGTGGLTDVDIRSAKTEYGAITVADLDINLDKVAIGVVVIDESDNWIGITKDGESSSQLPWSPTQEVPPGVDTAANSTALLSLFTGAKVTNPIIKYFGNSSDYAALFCKNFTLLNGQRGYLPAGGEWNLAYSNKAEVNSCIDLIGGTAIFEEMYWTAISVNAANNAWFFRWSNGSNSYLTKTSSLRVRAFYVPRGTVETVGVAVIEGNHKFMIPKQDGLTSAWSKTTREILNIVSSDNQETAIKDFFGNSNTDYINTQSPDDSGSFQWVVRQYSLNGQRGYIPSLGEMNLAYGNKTEVDTCMSLIGGTAMVANEYWTSTQYSDTSAWTFHWQGSRVGSGGKSDSYQVRSFAPLVLSDEGLNPDNIAIVNYESDSMINVSLNPSTSYYKLANTSIDLGTGTTSGRSIAENSVDYAFTGTYGNTIISKMGAGNAPAAEACKNFVFPNGQNGYLPTLWGLMEMITFPIDGLLSFVSGVALLSNDASGYWSSTEYNTANMWIVRPTATTKTTSAIKTTANQWIRPITSNDWNIPYGKKINGVLVIGSNAETVVALKDLPSLKWSNVSGLIEGVLAASSGEEAYADKRGWSNTQRISVSGETGTIIEAAKSLDNFIVTSDINIGLPAAGEMKAISDNQAAVNNLLTWLNATPLQNALYATSTQASATNIWAINPISGEVSSIAKTTAIGGRSIAQALLTAYDVFYSGILVKQGDHVFVLSPTYTVNIFEYLQYNAIPPAVPLYPDMADAVKDFDGKGNYEKMLSSDSPAARWISGYNSYGPVIAPMCYLPALGQLNIVAQNFENIKSINNSLGMNIIYDNSNAPENVGYRMYWSSTLESIENTASPAVTGYMIDASDETSNPTMGTDSGSSPLSLLPVYDPFISVADQSTPIQGAEIVEGENLVLTNDQGEATIPMTMNKDHSYTVSKDTYITQVGTTGVLTEEKNIIVNLERAIQMILTVKENTDSGVPVAGAAYQITIERDTKVLQEGTTDSNGIVIFYADPTKRYQMSISKEGYKSRVYLFVAREPYAFSIPMAKYYNITVNVKRAGVNQFPAAVTLGSLPSQDTDENGNVIYTNIEYKTGVNLSVDSNQYWKAYSSTVDIDSNKTINVALEPLYVVRVETGQTNAQIVLTGIVTGTHNTGVNTYVDLVEVPIGTFGYTVSKSGYSTKTGNYEVAQLPVEQYTVSVILTKLPKLVQVTTSGTTTIDKSYQYLSILAFAPGGNGGNGTGIGEGGGGGGGGGVAFAPNIPTSDLTTFGFTIGDETLGKFDGMQVFSITKGGNGGTYNNAKGGYGGNGYAENQSPRRYGAGGSGGGGGGSNASNAGNAAGSSGIAAGGDGTFSINGGNGASANGGTHGTNGTPVANKYIFPLTTIFNGTGKGGAGNNGGGGAGGYGNGGNGGALRSGDTGGTGGYGAGGGGGGGVDAPSGAAGGAAIACLYYHNEPITVVGG